MVSLVIVLPGSASSRLNLGSIRYTSSLHHILFHFLAYHLKRLLFFPLPL